MKPAERAPVADFPAFLAGGLVKSAMILPGIDLKLHRALTFLATIGIDLPAMKFMAMIWILALLTMSGAAISDQLLTADQHVAQGVK